MKIKFGFKISVADRGLSFKMTLRLNLFFIQYIFYVKLNSCVSFREVSRFKCLQEKLFVAVLLKLNILHSVNSSYFLKFLKLHDLRLKRNWKKR